MRLKQPQAVKTWLFQIQQLWKQIQDLGSSEHSHDKKTWTANQFRIDTIMICDYVFQNVPNKPEKGPHFPL